MNKARHNQNLDRFKYQVMAFFDTCRWEWEKNGGRSVGGLTLHREVEALKSSDKELYQDVKVLTHWLCYIAERQTKFENIWGAGGSIYSRIVLDYLRTIRAGEDVDKWLRAALNPGGKYLKRSRGKEQTDVGEEKAPEYKFTAADGCAWLEFAPRFWKDDYVSIYYTLHALAKYGGSLKEYIRQSLTIPITLEDEKSLPDAKVKLYKIVYALYCLTYAGLTIGKKTKTASNCGRKELLKMRSASKKNIKEIVKVLGGGRPGAAAWGGLSAKAHTEALEKCLRENGLFRYFFVSDLHFVGTKRVWCCVRDYVKKPDYDFVLPANTVNRKAMREWLELPGDMWNNDSRFSNCCFKKEYAEASVGNGTRKKITLNRLLRTLYNDAAYHPLWGDAYPEQFDCTFDFVPRMCAKHLCELCPFQGGMDAIKSICIGGGNVPDSRWCTVALVCCGYQVRCKGSACALNPENKESEK